ncbi:MAG: polysaccharide biosynthesis tyrosine autokinase [Pyrinomonadaceae bacterium]|nr:polysaccharide biosynthesis tyrosine autokinase [Pyrinomonadaceae bacterium]
MKERQAIARRGAEIQSLESPVEELRPPSQNYGYSAENVDADEVHLRDYWRYVRKRLWLVIGVTLLVTIIATIYMARKPDIYEAQARVQVDLENNGPLGGTAKNGSVIVNSPVNDPAYFNTQLQILMSPGLLRRVVKTLDLEHNQDFLRPYTAQNRSLWQNLLRMVRLGDRRQSADKSGPGEIPTTSQVAPPTQSEDLAEAKRLAPYVRTIQESLKIEPVKDTRLAVRETRLIDIRFEHPDPQVAAKVANAIANTFVLSNLERKSEANNTTGDFLQKRIAELQAEIRRKEEELVNYAKNHQIVSLDASQNTVVDRLSGLNKQLLEAENDRKLAEAAYRAALAPGAATSLAEESAKQIAETEGKLAELKAKRDALLVENTEEYFEVKEVNDQIAALERSLKEMRSRATTVVISNLETRYRQALAREESLRKAFNEQRGETMVQNEAAINYKIIQQEIETNKGLLDGLLQRSKENDVMMAGTPNNIHVVDYAIMPDWPIGPRRMQSIMLAFVLSLGCGVGLALFLEYLDDTVGSAEDVEKMLHLPALCVIPSSNGKGQRRLSISNALQRNGNVDTASELLLNADARSPLAEAYRQLRTSVLLSTAGHAPRTLLVTSSIPGEGKTTTAVNLAVSMAQTGASVLLIDADMRRPRLHTIFDIEKRRGLSTILSSEASQADILEIVEQHQGSGLHLLTSGPVPPNPAELIGSEQMRSLISMLQTMYTHIIIDSPPIASFTDGVLLSSMIDGVLFVVHGGKSTRTVVKRARQLLQDVGAKILGVVLNNVNLRSDDYYYYQRYYQQSYYKADPETESLTSDAQY